MRLKLLLPQSQRPGKSGVNQGAIQQEIVQNDNEHTKGEIIGRGMGGDGPFLSTWCRFKTSLGYARQQMAERGHPTDSATLALYWAFWGTVTELRMQQSSQDPLQHRQKSRPSRTFPQLQTGTQLAEQGKSHSSSKCGRSQSNSPSGRTLLADPPSPAGVWKQDWHPLNRLCPCIHGN